MSTQPIKDNVVDFEKYRRLKNPTDEELFMEAFGSMTEEQIQSLIDELCDLFGVEEPANDDELAFKSIMYFTPEGDEVWESDGLESEEDAPSE
jgi:hypothetical protein